jgi:hypothetical protein
MGMGSSSNGEHGRRLLLAATAEPMPLFDAALAAVAKTKVEQLRRYLEVS